LRKVPTARLELRCCADDLRGELTLHSPVEALPAEGSEKEMPMPIARAKEFILCAALAASVTGCAGAGRLSSDAPAGVSLGGAWRLNPGVSDDTQKIIEQLRARAAKRSGRRPVQTDGRGGMPGRGMPRGGDDEDQPDEQPEGGGGGPGQQGPAGFHGDPLQGSPVMHILMSDLVRGNLLTIRQSPDLLVLDYGSSVRRFSPGGHSVVSVEGGVADQTSGWKGKEYVIEIRPQVGPQVTERYRLSEDHKQLVVKVRLSGAEMPKVDLTRVYDPAGTIVPRTLPSSD
jgi:hypothetical protein